MIIRKKKKVCHTRNVIADVRCDGCGKSLVEESDFIYRLDLSRLYIDSATLELGGTDCTDYSLELCAECVTPVERQMRKIDRNQ